MIKCRIEQLRTESECAWILSIPATAVADTIVRFVALHFEKIEQVRFSDKCSGVSAVIERDNQVYTLLLDGAAIPVTKIWLEAVTSILTETAINGWSITSHIDQDFTSNNEIVTVCIFVDPPI